MPLAGLIVRHVLENLVFVPIMVGMIFFLIEFYGGDKFLAFSVLSMVWLCEVFSAIRGDICVLGAFVRAFVSLRELDFIDTFVYYICL